ELADLGNMFNKMAEALGRMDEERKQVDKAKTEFISITSHELRSPMTPMKAQLQMLKKGYFGPINRKQRESADIVLRNTERLDKIILEFLEVSRIEAARLRFNFVKCSLNAYISRLVKEMGGLMPKKKTKIITKIGKLPEIECDPDKVMQVLRNLLNNAIKFSRSGSKVVLDAQVKGRMIEFSVRDWGCGIAPEYQKRIFEPFFQEEQTIYREHGGAGLGLTICSGIAEAQNGSTWVKSIPGKGSTFYFTIPIKPVRKIKPIRLLFSPQLLMESELKDLFREELGDEGLDEYYKLENQKMLTSEGVRKYVSSLTREGKLAPVRARDFLERALEILEGKEKKQKDNITPLEWLIDLIKFLLQ
ncbi:MAG: HAMP domain-containing sensor histidine kinase, partial [Candidatus Woesearchaeota archaeon]